MPSVLIAGASGLVGNATLERALSRNGWTEVIALSRRRPEIDSVRPFTHLSVDLRDAAAARSALSDIGDITHLVYAALYEKPGLITGWLERDQMQTNLTMLKDCLEPLLGSKSLQQVTILQGTWFAAPSLLSRTRLYKLFAMQRADAFEVLAEPRRRRIVELLAEGERPVGDLVDELGLSQPGVSRHLRVLREAGLVDVRADAQRRLYGLRSERLREIDEWISRFRALWTASLDELERHLDQTER